MEVLFKQGKGFARMYVAMRTPSGEMKMPIGSEYLVKNLTKQGEWHHRDKKIRLSSIWSKLIKNTGTLNDKAFKDEAINRVVNKSNRCSSVAIE